MELADEQHLDPEVATRLKDKRAALAKLRADMAERLLDEEMERLRNGGRSPKMAAAIKSLEELRAKTVKEKGPNGVELALYLVPHRSYMDPTGMGGVPRLNEKDAIVKLSVDQLPGEDWKAVEPTQAKLEQQYRATA